MFNANPADLHSAAAVHAAGQVIEFNDTGAPVQEQGIVLHISGMKLPAEQTLLSAGALHANPLLRM